MKKLMTKKNILGFSLLGTFILISSISLQEINACYDSWTWCRGVWGFLDSWGPFILPFPVLLISSLVTYKLHDKVFYTWLKFSTVAIPVILLLVAKSPESAYGGFLASAMTVTRSEASLQLSVLYLVLSLMLIAWKWFTLRKKK